MKEIRVSLAPLSEFNLDSIQYTDLVANKILGFYYLHLEHELVLLVADESDRLETVDLSAEDITKEPEKYSTYLNTVDLILRKCCNKSVAEVYATKLKEGGDKEWLEGRPERSPKGEPKEQ